MKIVALDIATHTGVAVGSSGGDPKAWSVDLGEAMAFPRGFDSTEKKRLNENHRFSEVLRLSHGLITTHKPDLVVCEAAVGGQDASAFLIGLIACVRGVAKNQGVDVTTVAPASVRKHFLGKALKSNDFPGMSHARAKIAIKERVAERCRLLGWQVDDLDCADALATWDWAMANHATDFQAAPLGGLFRA